MHARLSPVPFRPKLVLCWSSPTPLTDFTARDRITLEAWQRDAERHGYSRVLIEPGAPGTRPDGGSYALVYRSGWAWAAWGLARRDDTVLVWDCGSGADFGRFPTVQQALAALPSAGYRQAVSRRAASAMSASGPQ